MKAISKTLQVQSDCEYSPAGGLGEGWAGWAKAPPRPTDLGAVAGGEEAVAAA